MPSATAVLFLAASLTAIAIGSSAHLPAKAAPRDSRHTVHIGQMAVTIPRQWRASLPLRQFGTTTWTFEGPGEQVQLSRQSEQTNAWQLLPMVPIFPGSGVSSGATVYQDSLQTSGAITRQVLSATGTVYTVSISGRAMSMALEHQILASWRHPPVSTVTDAVHRMITAGLPEFQEDFATSQDGWILAGGAPGAGQEVYYLFDTRSHGKTWSLERYTRGSWCRSQAPRCEFIAGAGYQRMLFWNAADGIIASASSLVDRVSVLRTFNAGKTWTPLLIKTSISANGIRLIDRRGVLILTVLGINGQRPWTVQSINSGQSWIPIPEGS